MVSNSTLSTDIWTDVRTILVAAAPYVTNSSTSATTAASIVAAYNDQDVNRPTIAINPIATNESDYKFGSNEGKKFINVTIDCYYKNTLGVDQLIDQVINALKNTDIDGCEIIATATDYAFNLAADSKYHLKSVTVTYDRE